MTALPSDRPVAGEDAADMHEPAVAGPAGRGMAAGVRPNAIVGASPPRLAAILVNCNSAADSIECLESLMRADQPVRIIVVDNASDDDCIARIHAWASGAAPFLPPDGPLGRLTRPPLRKPIPLRELRDTEALTTPPGDELLTLIRSSSNRGFAGGHNLGLRHALLDPAVGYCWCLDNGTVVEADAPRALLARLDATPKVGMCGTQVRFYHRPDIFRQLNGARFQLLTGQGTAIGAGQPVSTPFDPQQVARETDFVPGASLAVSRAFLETVGFMEEGYFLYYEEIDWAVRNHGRFQTAFAHGAILYHKQQDAAGEEDARSGIRAGIREYHLLKSRLKFYRRNFPLLLPLQYLLAFWQIERRLLRGQPGKAWAMLKAMLGLPGSRG